MITNDMEEDGIIGIVHDIEMNKLNCERSE